MRGSKAKTDIVNIIKMKAATNKHINLYIFIHFLVFYHEIVMTFESGLRFHKLEHIESVTDNRYQIVRKDMDVNGHETLFNITLKT